MSLINDALKRAKQAQQKTPPPPATGAPLRPIESSRPQGAGLGMLIPIAIALLLLLVGVVLIWMAVARSGKRPAPVVTQAKPVTTQSAPAPIAETPHPAPAVVEKKIVQTPTVAPAVAPTTPVNPQPVVVAPPVPAPVVEAAPVTTAPSAVVEAASVLPKLQGIFYRPDRPSALLNGKTIMVGGRSGDFLVVAISQQSVTVVRAGATNVLSLAE